MMSVIEQGAFDASFLHDALQVSCRQDRAELTPCPLAGYPSDAADDEVAESVLGGGKLHRHRGDAYGLQMCQAFQYGDRLGVGVLYQESPGLTAIDVRGLD
jgi:hypothetical protein